MERMNYTPQDKEYIRQFACAYLTEVNAKEIAINRAFEFGEEMLKIYKERYEAEPTEKKPSYNVDKSNST